MNNIDNLYQKSLNDEKISKEEALSLLNENPKILWNKANDLRIHFCGKNFDLCTIINGKSGRCSENCKYCAQSSYYSTEVETYPLLDKDKFLQEAKVNEKAEAHRFSIVTSGKTLSKSEVDKISKIYKAISIETKIKLCASHGLLDSDDLIKLKESGVTRIHNNLETSERYFPYICTTHTYEDKIKTIKAAQKIGLDVCCGGIIGLGETKEDRIDLALTIRDLNIKSIPINILNPIKNTPFENNKPLSYDEIKTTIAIFRFINPKAQIRLAGGRSLIKDEGKEAFLSGANASITGALLTTSNYNIEEDKILLKKIGYLY